MTFEQLDLLLRQVSEGMDGSSDWPPPQEKECMVVATLNLLRLQVGNSLSTVDVSLQMYYSFVFVAALDFLNNKVLSSPHLLSFLVYDTHVPNNF